MACKKYVVQIIHVAVTAAALFIVCSTAPTVLFCFTGVAYFLLYALVAYSTFRISRSWLLDERISPDGKAVLITGCDTGFGNALAKRLDSRGFHVFASCLFPEGEGATDLKLSCSNRMKVLQLDVTKDDSVQEALSFVQHNLGSKELWAIVNNAGVFKGVIVDLSSMEDYQANMDVNALGPIRVTKAFLPLMRKSKGRIVNITSVCARLTYVGMSAYLMSKHAALAFTDCLDLEMREFGIKAISIEPEGFQSAMFSKNSLSRVVDDAVSKASEDNLATYGKDYFEKMKEAYTFTLALVANLKCDVVIDDIERAISHRYPEHVYRPRVNIFNRCLYYIHEIMPYEIYAFLVNTYMFAAGYPSVSSKPQHQ